MREDLQFSNPADPQQWDAKTRNARDAAPGGARPCLTFDNTNQYIRQVVNSGRQSRPGIFVVPSDSGADIQTAQAIEGMIRQIEYTSRASMAYDTALDHAARNGVGWLRVVTETVDEAMRDQDLRIKAVYDPLTVTISPESVEIDGRDASDGFVETTMSQTTFEARFGKKASKSNWDSGTTWVTDRSIRICEYFKQVENKSNRLNVVLPDNSRKTLTEGEYWDHVKNEGYRPLVTEQFITSDYSVDWCLMGGDEILDETKFPSRWIPLIPVYGNVLVIDGKRYVCGLTRQLMDGQRAKNFERSAQIELMAMQPKSPFVLPFESVENFEADWASANSTNAAALYYNAFDVEGRPLPSPQRMTPPVLPSAYAQGAQLAVDDMQAAVGMYKSNLGAPSNAISGRAKMQDQREGDTATYHYLDNLNYSIEHVGRILVNAIPQIYDERREARILGLNGDSKPIRINPNIPSDHSTQVPTINPGSGTYDVRIKSGPSYATQRQESAEALTNLVGKSPQLMTVLGPTWARMQDWPEADKVAKLLLSMAPPQVQALENEDVHLPPDAQRIVSGLKAQLQQMQQQMQQLSADANKVKAQAEQDHQANLLNNDKNEISKYEAETKRIIALKPPDPGMTVEQVQLLVMQLMQSQGHDPMPQDALFTPVQTPPPSGPGGEQLGNVP